MTTVTSVWWLVIKGKKDNYYRMRIDGSVVVIDTVLVGSRGDIYKKIGDLG